ADVQRQGRQGIPRESGSRDQGGSNSGPVLQGPSRGRPACLLYGDQEADTRPCVPCHDGEACEGYPTRREPRHKYRNPQVHDAGHDASQAAAGRIQGQARSCRRAPEGDTGQNQESGDPGDGEHERRSPAEDAYSGARGAHCRRRCGDAVPADTSRIAVRAASATAGAKASHPAASCSASAPGGAAATAAAAAVLRTAGPVHGVARATDRVSQQTERIGKGPRPSGARLPGAAGPAAADTATYAHGDAAAAASTDARG
ncbi:unnamed protein product, partial [Prorocentrum cordatum]